MKNNTPNQSYADKTTKLEDQVVIDFLTTLDPSKKAAWLEAGAGLGRFLFKMRDELQSIAPSSITCIDISKSSCDALKAAGFNVVEGSVQKMPFKDESFDIVHASHLIEHFAYPAIADVLDELVRVTKKGGHIIIHSPLMYSGFWNDLDHVRPYPPKAILQYFEYKQQQRIGAGSLKLVHEWQRHIAWGISAPNAPQKLVSLVNNAAKKMWMMWEFPKSKSTGFVALFQKI